MRDSNGLSKDQLTRSRVNRNWERKIKLVKKATDQLEDPLFLLNQLKSLMQQNESFGLDILKAEPALKELQSFFLLSKHVVPNQDCANEIEEFPPKGLLITALKEAKEQSQSFQEELKQITAIMEQKQQSLDEAKVYNLVASFFQKVVKSCSDRAISGILNQDKANQIQGYRGVEIKGEQLRISFPQIPDSIHINQKGKNAEIHDEEMIVLEPQGNEVIITLLSVAGRLAELKLSRKMTDQGMRDLPPSNSWDIESIYKLLLGEDVTVKDANLDEGTSNAAANEADVKLSTDETRIVQGYKVFNRNADVLNEIFQEYSNIAENFRVAHSDSQSFYMNSLAEVYKKIMKSKREIVEPDDIKNMKKMVGDMEHVGLQVTWLKEMLEIQERKRELQEKIESFEAKKTEAKQELVQLDMLEKKKRPFWGGDSMSCGFYSAMRYLDSFPLQIQKYVVKIIDVLPDGHCGFRSIAGLLGFGSDGWLKVRQDLIEELCNYRSYYVNFYGSNEVFDELLDTLSCFKVAAPYKNWMTLPEMGHLIASRYDVVLVHISAKQCMTYLPLRSTPPSPSEHRIIVIGFVNDNHFVQVLMDSTSPIPPIACNWYKFRHDNALGWETPYQARIKVFMSLILKDSDVATQEVIDLDEP
ncbi:hypothetical protein DITRI_Ditri09bG0033100 [Diplodiscus trichospermus]